MSLQNYDKLIESADAIRTAVEENVNTAQKVGQAFKDVTINVNDSLKSLGQLVNQKADVEELKNVSYSLAAAKNVFNGAGYIVRGTGKVSANVSWKCTDFLELDFFSPLILTGRDGTSASILTFYDKSGNYLSDYYSSGQNTIFTLEVPVSSYPLDAKYIRCSAYLSQKDADIRQGVIWSMGENARKIVSHESAISELREEANAVFSHFDSFPEQTYITATIDSANCLLEGVKRDGTKVVNALEIDGQVEKSIESDNFISLTLDAEDKILEAIRKKDGTKVMNALELNDLARIERIKENEKVFVILDNKNQVLFSIDKKGKSYLVPSDKLLKLIQDKLNEIETDQSDYKCLVNNLYNPSLPKNPSQLKILGIGNSFTDNGMYYLPDLLKSAGINNVTLGRLIYGGCSLQQHWDFYINNSEVYTYYKSIENSWQTIRSNATFKEAVEDENWDIIIIQQVSQNSGLYHTYQPYMTNLIEAMKTNCSNAGVTLGWQMTWAYSTNSTHSGFNSYGKDQKVMYDAIVKAVKENVADTGVDIIIPSGTAIQNLRTTAINNYPDDLTSDGYHIDSGAGRYTLACTWFQTLIAPCFNVSIANNSFRTNTGLVPVTDNNFRLCQWAAQYACSKRFEITNLESMINV